MKNLSILLEKSTESIYLRNIYWWDKSFTLIKKYNYIRMAHCINNYKSTKILKVSIKLIIASYCPTQCAC